MPAGKDTIDQIVIVPIIDDRINEANEGLLLVVRAMETLNDPSDLAKLSYRDEGVTLLRITDDDSEFTSPHNLPVLILAIVSHFQPSYLGLNGHRMCFLRARACRVTS